MVAHDVGRESTFELVYEAVTSLAQSFATLDGSIDDVPGALNGTVLGCPARVPGPAFPLPLIEEARLDVPVLAVPSCFRLKEV